MSPSPRTRKLRWLTALLALAAILMLAGGPAAAQHPKPPAGPLSLQQTIDMALAYSPTLEASRHSISKAEYQRQEARTYYLPELSTSYGATFKQNPQIVRSAIGDFQTGSKDTYFWSTQVKAPIFTGFRVSSNYRLAELGVNLAEVNLSLDRLDVGLKAKEAYFLYLRAQKALGVAQQAVVQLESHLKVSQDFYDVGIIPVNDLLKTKVELAQAQQDEVTASNEVNVARSQLNTLLGLPVESPLDIEDILRYEPYSINYEKARAAAQLRRPELQALDLQLEQADQSIRYAQSEYYPQVGLVASYDFTSDRPELGDNPYYDPTDWAVMAQVDWSLFQWGRTRDKVGQARADRMRLESVKRDLQDQVDLQVKQAILYLDESAKNIHTSKTAIEQAKENYRVTKERYQEQLTTNTELLDAQTLLTQAQNNYYTALTVYNVAEARLLRAMGQGLAVNAKQDGQ